MIGTLKYIKDFKVYKRMNGTLKYIKEWLGL